MGQTDVHCRQIEFMYLCLPEAAGKARLGYKAVSWRLFFERRDEEGRARENNVSHGTLFSVGGGIQYVKVFLNKSIFFLPFGSP